MTKLINYRTGLQGGDSYYNDFCDCCGSSLVKNISPTTKLHGNTKGIRMALGELPCTSTKKFEGAVVQTKNGPISLSIRVEPYGNVRIQR